MSVRWAPAVAAVAVLVTGLAVPEPAGWELAVMAGVPRSPAVIAVMEAASALGSSATLAVLCLVVGVALRRSPLRWLPAGAYVGAVASYSVLNPLIGRDRPLDGSAVFGQAMPSGHATQATAVLLVCASVVAGRRRVPLVLAGLAAGLVGVSRVVLAVHWPADVLAGWALGAAWFVALAPGTVRGRGGGGARGPDV